MRRQEAQEKAKALVDQMTVSEAVSQLRYDSPAIERLGIPAYQWWNEALHGVARGGTATGFPQAIGMAAAFDTDLMRAVGNVISTEARARYNAASSRGDRDIYKGLTFWAPNINIFRDPRWGRGHETYGEDPLLTAEIGCAFVRGIQGEGDTLKAAACAKHFAVHSGPEKLRHGFDAKVSPKDLWETYLPAFRALVCDAGVEAVMGAYNRVNGEPCCGSRMLLQDILRGKWGFQGHVTSDCWALKDFHGAHQVTKDATESAAMALNHGCDLNCGCTYLELMKALGRGLVTESTIRQAAVRLFTTRYRLGMMEGSEYDRVPYTVVDCTEHRKLAHQMALESCVLLKNNGLLPLRKNQLGTVAVIGPNADSCRALIGNYHGTSSRYITVSEAVQEELEPQVRVLYSQGSDLCKPQAEPQCQPGDRLFEAAAAAEAADAVILVLGLDETLEGEEGDSGDKQDLLLPYCQRQLAETVLATGKPTVIVLMAGSAIDLGTAGEQADAVLQAWYPGPRGGKAVSDLLFGHVSPSGKLPVTFYHNEQLAQMPDFSDYSMRGRTYRYFEGEPLYPFGYGLTYGDVFTESASAEVRDGQVTITARVRNAGDMATGDVLQVYVQNEDSPNAPLHPRLAGFVRVWVPAGETVSAKIAFPADRLLVINEEGESVPEGHVVLYAGMGQPDVRTEVLTGHRVVKILL